MWRRETMTLGITEIELKRLRASRFPSKRGKARRKKAAKRK
jgi:hypothetical protein